MRRAVQNKTPQFTITEKKTEVYPFEKDGLQLKSSYTAEDVKNQELTQTSPGIAPYLEVRILQCMFRNHGRSVSMQVFGRRIQCFYRRNLAAGQKGLSVAFDLATHRGYDSDHASCGRCWKSGCSD
jgi:methylmalonyl-CoA mutase